MFFYMFVWMLSFFSGMLSFCSNRKHLLAMLLSLEFIMLSVFMLLCFFLSFFQCELYFGMVFLTFSVCEGTLGMSILVVMVRTHGNDYFQTFSILQC
uniref:NADH-ubiquinone oxidoreductase chain 4L n=1 Tax=Conocephalus differentus TaxID=948348 RepID=A0A343S7G1_9ORTH|nr:NADH dehydrogenase subunit 4L [Conocephalus differentus]